MNRIIFYKVGRVTPLALEVLDYLPFDSLPYEIRIIVYHFLIGVNFYATNWFQDIHMEEWILSIYSVLINLTAYKVCRNLSHDYTPTPWIRPQLWSLYIVCKVTNTSDAVSVLATLDVLVSSLKIVQYLPCSLTGYSVRSKALLTQSVSCLIFLLIVCLPLIEGLKVWLVCHVINISETYGSSRKVINFVTFSCNDV